MHDLTGEHDGTPGPETLAVEKDERARDVASVRQALVMSRPAGAVRVLQHRAVHRGSRVGVHYRR